MALKTLLEKDPPGLVIKKVLVFWFMFAVGSWAVHAQGIQAVKTVGDGLMATILSIAFPAMVIALVVAGIMLWFSVGGTRLIFAIAAGGLIVGNVEEIVSWFGITA